MSEDSKRFIKTEQAEEDVKSNIILVENLHIPPDSEEINESTSDNINIQDAVVILQNDETITSDNGEHGELMLIGNNGQLIDRDDDEEMEEEEQDTDNEDEEENMEEEEVEQKIDPNQCNSCMRIFKSQTVSVHDCQSKYLYYQLKILK